MMSAKKRCQNFDFFSQNKTVYVYFLENEQVTQQAEDPAGVTDEELWDKVIRTILMRFDKLTDAIKPPTKKATPDAEVEYMKKLKKYAQEKEEFEIYHTLLNRDKEIFQMRLDIYDLKRSLLEHFGQTQLLGDRPRYIPPPKVNVKMPAPVPKYVPPPPPKSPTRPTMMGGGSGPVTSPTSDYSFGKRGNNEIFRTIMASKSQEGLNVLQDEGEGDDYSDLSDGWDNIPPTEYTGDDMDDDDEDDYED